jgi:putative inorganic carbon (HCO3(-)) transporter
VLVLLLVLRAIRSWPKLWRRLVPIALLVLAGVALAIAVTQVDPIRTRVASLLAG